MGQPAARLGDMTSHGTPLGPGPGLPTALIGGQPAWRVGDSHLCPLANGPQPHVGGIVAVGAVTLILVNGLFMQSGPHPAPIFAIKPLPVVSNEPTGAVKT